MNRYDSAEGFKQALEDRIRKAVVGVGADMARERQLIVFDRFLVRASKRFGQSVMLKGGLALEIRLARSRTTKDVDLRFVGSPEKLLPELQAAGQMDLNDFMVFEIQIDARHPEIQGEGVKYGGQRFRAECRLAGKVYGRPFAIDVAFGDPILGDGDEVMTSDALVFAGLPRATLRVYPVESHLAEKVHAYTLPRSTPNSRVKDLPDLALLASVGELNSEQVAAALKVTFGFRNTHEIPKALQSPPIDWEAPYAEMAAENELAWPNLKSVSEAAKSFLDPVLADSKVGIWYPKAWAWKQ